MANRESLLFNNFMLNNKKQMRYKGCNFRVVPNLQSTSKILQDMKIESGPHNDGYDALYEELKPMWIMLRVLGCLPIQKSDRGLSKFKLISKQMLYAICYVAFICALYSFTVIIYSRNKPQKRMAAITAWVFMKVVLGLQPIVIAFTHWWKAEEVRNLMNDWTAFQDQYYLVTRSHLHLRLRRTSTVLVVGVIIISGVRASAFAEWSTTERATCSFYYAYCLSIKYLHMVLWCSLCEASKRAASVLMASLKQDFVSSRRSTAQLVHEYRCLWLQLSHLTRDIGNAFCYAYGVMCILWVGQLLFCHYLFLTTIVGKINLHLYRLFVIWLSLSIEVALVCHYGSWAPAAVGDSFKKGLTELQTTDKETREQLLHFVLTITGNEPTISLGGFVTVNRDLLMTIYATIVTYMVVLMQFQD